MLYPIVTVCNNLVKISNNQDVDCKITGVIYLGRRKLLIKKFPSPYIYYLSYAAVFVFSQNNVTFSS